MKTPATKTLKLAADIAQASEFIASKTGRACKPKSPRAGRTSPAGRNSAFRLPAPWSRKRPIYIFDDSFSALDFKTDAALRKALKEQTGDSTMLIVTQRIATIKNAEQIIVLDEGKIVGKGTP